MKLDVVRVIDMALKVAILVALALILSRMPPTLADLKNAKTAEQKRALGLKRPCIYVDGTVTADVIGTVDVNVENQPLGVEVW